MATPLETRLAAVLRGPLARTLRSHQFRRRGSVFLSRRAEVVWIVDIQKSQWNDAGQLEFTVNGGVYVPGIVSGYLGRPEPRAPSLGHCCVSVRIGMLTASRLDRWWRLALSDLPGEIDERLAAEVSSVIESTLLPFLAQFVSLQSVAGFLSAPVDSANRLVSPQNPVQRRTFAALVFARIGDDAKAQAQIAQAALEARGTPIEAFVRRVAEGLLSSGKS